MGCDPTQVEKATLKETIERAILDRKLPPSSFTNSAHDDLVRLVDEGRITIAENFKLHASWALGR